MAILKLYGLDASPPVRAVKLTLAALQLDYEFIVVDVTSKQQLSKEYLAKNPQHTVPLLEDGDACIWDSHAIMCYLVSKYSRDDSLYPRDLLKRAVVDQRLHFESGVVFANALRAITKLVLFFGVTEVPKERIEAITEAYDFVELFLKGHSYMAGDQLTLADLSLISSISSLVAYVPVDAAKYFNLSNWIKRMELLPYYEQNAKGAAMFAGAVKSKTFTVAQ
ncbi:glutathione S-transferase 1-like [Drosophila busckii]|uniref:glutathione S-transferase 1-like n=1 Tax=Drosophila busckii TaxID=30019 RepID=UPI001432AC83|nr:glutathione S-transferase 1-like [Drosophila busckii]